MLTFELKKLKRSGLVIGECLSSVIYFECVVSLSKKLYNQCSVLVGSIYRLKRDVHK